jgi:hypothetical protein
MLRLLPHNKGAERYLTLSWSNEVFDRLGVNYDLIAEKARHREELGRNNCAKELPNGSPV